MRPLVSLLERCSGIHSLNQIYHKVRLSLVDSEHDPAFFIKTLQVMGVSIEIDRPLFEHLLQRGPLIVVANHPFGGLDGVVMGALLSGVRSDSKLMGNYFLSRIDGIRGSLIKVDPFERRSSARANLTGMREAQDWLQAGGCLGVFPAGEVSAFNSRSLSVVDRPWSPHIVSLALRSGASVLPIYFEGRNSWVFLLAGIVHARFRTLLLAREFCKKCNTTVLVRMGRPVSPETMKLMGKKRVITDYLRLQTYLLKKNLGIQKPYTV
ncbi:MAG: lysophospholipid acyltransferase family protein [Coraliomargaritaceae bacterium]